MMNCIVIDDEPMARSLIKDYCEKVPAVNLTGEFPNGIQALEFLKKNKIDLIFLDIKMPDITGLDLMRIIGGQVRVVFTTAFSEYALDGFELDAIDYLLKPFDFSRFLKAVNKAENQMRVEITSFDVDLKKCFFIKNGRELVKIQLADLLYIKGSGDYVTFCLKDKKIMSLMTLKELEKDLPDHFLRIHQSYIINKQQIMKIKGDKVEIGSEFIPVSRSYKRAFVTFLKEEM